MKRRNDQNSALIMKRQATRHQSWHQPPKTSLQNSYNQYRRISAIHQKKQKQGGKRKKIKHGCRIRKKQATSAFLFKYL
jgi:hypothetical protein